MPLQVDLSSDGNAEFDRARMASQIEKAVKTAIRIASLKLPENAELSILFGNDKTLQTLNLKWRSKDKPTNVLSFPGEEISPGQEAGMMLGDIAISLETADREATLENKNLDDHIIHLIVHGFLHLFGYDHENDAEADQMESLERKVLAELGISDPYA